MNAISYVLFETAIGACGIAWGRRGIVGLQLPEASAARARERLTRRFPSATEAKPPAEIGRAIQKIIALLHGEPTDLSGITLDMESVEPFKRRVYEIARTIPLGATLTYGDIAQKLGNRLLAQDVGKALGQNPFPIVVPCHRVVAAGGKTGGFSARGGVHTKLRMLAIEGAKPEGALL
jgi:methylated-DNA-[protein]-cysteine S-methyltransferase